MTEQELLISRLKEYSETEMYPFHMPGHKRLKGTAEGFGFPNPFLVDITEIDGFDNLHHAEGILKDSMEWAADIYGADKTFYLVNGSSCGILAAVSGCVPGGGRILISRNCHKSVYHAICLNQLKASYVYPQQLPGLGIQGGILAEDVERMLERFRDIKAVLIVSPTYDGVVSDIASIARVVHRAGLPLIVDEAHGAHFRYNNMFPVSALELGADVVIQSTHKTLPALTQTALLHIKYNGPGGSFYGDEEAIKRYLSIYQSSSPSYVLMSSIENSIFQMEKAGRPGPLKKQAEAYEKALKELRSRLSGMKRLKLAGQAIIGTGGVYDFDISKIVVSCRGTGKSGACLSEALREEFHLEMEMCGADYVTAITSLMDEPRGLCRLGDALLALDGRLEAAGDELNPGQDGTETGCVYSQANETAMTISQALESPKRIAARAESRGCICGEFVYIYPPGIPILAPGEWINRRVLEIIEDYIEKGLPVQGPEDETLKTLRVIEG